MVEAGINRKLASIVSLEDTLLQVNIKWDPVFEKIEKQTQDLIDSVDSRFTKLYEEELQHQDLFGPDAQTKNMKSFIAEMIVKRGRDHREMN